MAVILIVDDDEGMRSSLHRALACEGYEVADVADGANALAWMAEHRADLVLLDVLLPDIDGLEVCRRIREEVEVPVLLLTARDAVMDRVQGLDSGADDYLVKPFALDELLARVRALLRRSHPGTTERLELGDLLMDESTRTASRAGRLLDLTPREWELLGLFMRQPGVVLARRKLVGTLWGYPEGSNVLDVYIGYLRSKLEANGEPRLIFTVRGVGFVLRVEEQ
ncbi:MAG: response regulator transcription factor [Acidimicrobiales bacterium]